MVITPSTILAQVGGSSKATFTTAYREANQIESLRVLGTARLQYKQIVDSFLIQSEKGLSDEQLTQLPAAMSAAFRLSIVTARDNLSSQRSLTYQLETYEDTQILIDKLLLQILNLRKKDQVSRIAYETLLFARAYNRLAWAYQLSTATPWKQYVVLPFNQIAAMVRLAEQDLEQVLILQELPIPAAADRRHEKTLQTYTEILSKRLSTLPKDSIDYRIYQLLNQEDNTELLAQIIAKRNVYQTLWVLDTLQTADVAKGLDLMSKTYDYESSIGSNARPIFDSLEKIVRSIGLK
jgi:hypothetical protein